MICQSCNGVIGLDCFNPEECMAITQDQAARYREHDYLAGKLDQCEAALDQCRAENQSLLDEITRLRGMLDRVCQSHRSGGNE